MNHKKFIGCIGAVLCLCFAAIFLQYGSNNAAYALILSEGEVLEKIDLSEVIDPYEYPIEINGHTNVLLIEKGRVSMKSADCPDKLCVRQGTVSNPSTPIVCLPNKITVEVHADRDDDNVDGVSR